MMGEEGGEKKIEKGGRRVEGGSVGVLSGRRGWKKTIIRPPATAHFRPPPRQPTTSFLQPLLHPQQQEAAMGCLVSFLRSLRSYHGSHLTPRQLERQRRQRSQTSQPPTPPSSPEDDERRTLSFDGGAPPATPGPPLPLCRPPHPSQPTPQRSKAPKFFRKKR
ncbi:hypothetical protein O3P69_005294 [Scylla paramamosain]|uniref:Uncharacterized protein n=1 Tax=Scylla paramamosain TaxID=85552 RepID=A0AAW0UBK4_SCYPA